MKNMSTLQSNNGLKALYRATACFIILLLLTSTVGCSSVRKTAMPTLENKLKLASTDYNVVASTTQTLQKTLTTKVSIAYADTAFIYFKIDGYNLKEVYFREDATVEEGQLLAELDASDLEYRISTRQIDLKRVKLMYDKYLNDTTMDPADRSFQLKNLELDIESIELDIAYLEKKLEKTKLYAPCSGVVTYLKSVYPGSAVMAYETFVTIDQPDSYVFLSDVLNPANGGNVDLSNLVAGMEVTLIHGAADKRTEIPARISKIINTDPGVENNSNRLLTAPAPFRLEIKADEGYNDLFVVYRTLTLVFNTGIIENAVIVPKTAIKGTGDDRSVKLLKGNKVISRRVRTGAETSDKEHIVVTSGLRAGENVIVN